VRTEATLGLGGNVGDVVAAFGRALSRLAAHPQIALRKLSSVYRTPPWGKLDQPDFKNMAVLIETSLPAKDLLTLCLDLERQSGRERRERWGPRTLDIDILTYGSAAVDEPGLQIPHPRIAERAFVLAPLAEIAPGLLIAGSTVAKLWGAMTEPGLQVEPEATAGLRRALAEADA
jgi:2-amino-4-hydroxy-6-hydroxymethyldihydropteridine diphosphokinase